MNVEVLNIKENEDGSADVELELDDVILKLINSMATSRGVTINEVFIDILKKYIDKCNGGIE